MNPMLILFRKELGIARRPTYWASCLLMGALMIWIYVHTPIETIKTIAQTSPQIADYLATSWPQMFALLQPLWLFLLTWLLLSSEVFTMEKTDGRLEMLLTTPLHLREIWVAKCLALLVLVYPYVLLVSCLVFGLQSYVWPVQLGLDFHISTVTLSMAVCVGPLLAFGLAALLGLLALMVSNANVLQSISFFVTFAVGFGGNYALSALQKQAMSNLSELISWPVVNVYLAIALMLWVLILLLLRRLDKDHVVRYMA